jgi:hypothetical protein
VGAPVGRRRRWLGRWAADVCLGHDPSVAHPAPGGQAPSRPGRIRPVPCGAVDFFLAACQGAGLAVGAGALAGAFGRRGALSTILLVLAVVGGAFLFGASLAAEDHPAWPGWPVGAAIAWLSFATVSDFAAGAATRADGGGFIGGVIVFGALVTAGLSVILQPLGLVALVGIVYLGLARRARASRKYEGLRSLR